MQTFIAAQVDKHRQQGLYRKRHADAGAKVFCDNDYLGLAQDGRIIQALQQAAADYGVGGNASQIVVGHKRVHQQVEREFADFLQRDAALLFSNGYMANCGVVSALLGRNDSVVADKEIHASLIDATKLSGATLKR